MHVWLQGFWDADAFGALVVFEQGSHDARQGQSRTIESVAEGGLLVVLAAIAALEAVGLVGVEIAYAGNLKPAALGFAVDLEVVADGRGETLVAATQTQDAVREFEFAEQTLHVVEHLAVTFLRMFWGIYAHNLYF